MAGNVIYLFMWGYQAHYRIQIQRLAQNVLKKLGAPSDAEVLLVGARSPNSNNPNPVCVEPEDGKWHLKLFDGLLDSVESTYRNHDMQNMFFGDEPSMRDKPEGIRRDSVRTSVGQALELFDAEHDVTSFCGGVRRIDDYYVTPVIQIPNATFVHFPPLPPKLVDKRQQGSGFRSLIHAAMHAVLNEATGELQNPDPGRYMQGRMRAAEEIIRIAAKEFLLTPGLSVEHEYSYTDLFDVLNLVSSLMYEGAKGIGELILVDPENDAIEFLAKFTEPVPFREPRWARKVLQMATLGVGLIANTQYIFGLGKLRESHDYSAQDAFTVVFLDHYYWELRCGSQPLVRSHYAIPKLPQEPFDKTAFLTNYERLFPSSSQEDGLNIWKLMLIQTRQKHGSMIVVAEDAASEADRLSKQGTNIIPTRLTESLFRSVSGIDGTILLDPSGYCHAIGIILDGEANDNCTPSRGSRFNSGVRYVQSDNHRRLAIVVSDDHTADIIPRLRPLVSSSKIEQHIVQLETATLNNYHKSQNWLDKHRFYFNDEQCSRINCAIERLDALPMEVGVMYFGIKKFEVHSEMNDSYLTE